jgi:hypothetical protein
MIKINLGNKEFWGKVGEGSWRFSKTVVRKGIQAMAVETVGKGVTAVFEGDMDKAKKQFTFDEIVGPKKIKEDKPKKKLFGKKKEAEELLEAVETQTVDTDTIEEIVEEVESEVIDKKKK